MVMLPEGTLAAGQPPEANQLTAVVDTYVCMRIPMHAQAFIFVFKKLVATFEIRQILLVSEDITPFCLSRKKKKHHLPLTASDGNIIFTAFGSCRAAACKRESQSGAEQIHDACLEQVHALR